MIQVQPTPEQADRSDWTGIDHVQSAIPVGGEDVARRFYSDVLGLPEVARPPMLARRGGCWFAAGGVQLHLGADDDFRPARKAHPTLRRRRLDEFVERHDLDITWAVDVPGVRRGHVADPFGNRIELIEATDDP